MAKRRKSGWMNRLMQKVTLTEPGKKQAPMRKRKVAKKASKKSVKKAAKKVAKKASAQPLSVKERQTKELQTMYKIGVKDPERLARIISRMLQEAMIRDEENQLKFERLLWEKAEKKGQKTEVDREGKKKKAEN